jgi:hypothetical protein
MGVAQQFIASSLRLTLNLSHSTEPETLLPSLTIEAGAIIDFATEHSANLLRTDLYGDTPTTPEQERHLRTVAELQTRLTLSFVVTPHTSIKLENLDQAREYVRAYLMPMITAQV